MPILIHGDIGVEKNQAAKTIHSFSKRSNEPFINLNCFTISGSTLEIELFGYETSTPTGGYSEIRKGMLELADGGTLLISDIDQMPIYTYSANSTDTSKPHSSQESEAARW